ncbi:MAG: sulfite exporter TauE/SafE family protein [Candidatus Saccharimonadales bacterium]
MIASTLSGAAGGGGGMITTPFMVVLGLSPATAIATAKFGGLGLATGASSRFFKEQMLERRTILLFSAIGGIGALAGSLLLSNFSQHADIIRKLMGLVILLIGIPMLYIRKSSYKARQPNQSVKRIGYALLGVSTLLQASIGSGIGNLQMPLFIGLFGMTALKASASRRAMQITVSAVSSIVYIFAGLINYRFAIALVVTSLAGGYIGAHIAISKGNKFIINLFTAVSILLALRLLIGGF